MRYLIYFIIQTHIQQIYIYKYYLLVSMTSYQPGTMMIYLPCHLCCKLSASLTFVFSVFCQNQFICTNCVIVQVIVQIIHTKQLFIQKSTNECRSAVTRLFSTVMMNCDQEIDADKAGGNETLIPLQGFGFFSPCALEKIQSLFKV